MEIFKFKDFIKENRINKKLPVPKEIKELSNIFKENGKKFSICDTNMRDRIRSVAGSLRVESHQDKKPLRSNEPKRIRKHLLIPLLSSTSTFLFLKWIF